MRTMNLKEAAAFLDLHPETVKERARAGIIPGCKPGKAWRFIEEDLAMYLRSLYSQSRQDLQGDIKETTKCHSTKGKVLPITGSASPSRAKGYRARLGLTTR